MMEDPKIWDIGGLFLVRRRMNWLGTSRGRHQPAGTDGACPMGILVHLFLRFDLIQTGERGFHRFISENKALLHPHAYPLPLQLSSEERHLPFIKH